MKKLKAAALLCALAMLLAGCTPEQTVSETPEASEPSGETEDTTVNLSENTSYCFSLPDALVINDDDGVRLTSEDNTVPVRCTVADVPLQFGDWYGTSHTTSLFEEKEACWYIKNDLGFPALPENAEIRFDASADTPSRVEVYLSDDGYNFNNYAGQAARTDENGSAVYTLALTGEKAVKAVKFYVYSPVGSENAVLSVACRGKRVNERKLLSAGAAYTCDAGKDVRYGKFADDGVRLTDGISSGFAFTDGTASAMLPAATDSLMQRSVINTVIDLGSVGNVSEVMLTARSTKGTSGISVPDFICVKYSEDGSAWQDFCMCFADGEAVSSDGGARRLRTLYPAMRNHTVRARYIKTQIFSSGTVAVDEIAVYGSDAPVAEPEYTFTDFSDTQPVTDVAYALNGDIATLPISGSNAMTLSATGQSVTSAVLRVSGVSGAVCCGTQAIASRTVGGSEYMYFSFPATDNPVFVLTSDGNFTVEDIRMYSGGDCLPVIRGGWYSFFIDGISGYNSHHYFDEYRTYIELKGFRELGMDTVILSGQNLITEDKTTLIEPPAALAAKGYRKGVGHGVYDLNEAFLSACDRLGMKAYLSTVLSLAYPSLPAGAAAREEYLAGVLSDAEIIIPYIYNKYKSHPSFVGFYLVDETCDDWLAKEKSAGTDYTRRLYEGQSRVIRSLDESLLIAIAPAAWRSDTPERFGDNLRDLIKSTDGGRPIVDVVLVQDCLGREQSIAVSDAVYDRYAEYLRECARGVREAGAAFMNDTEIFDIGYRIKRADEIICSVTLESFVTPSTLVFDLSHYFSARGRGAFNKYAFFDNDCVVTAYVKYLSGIAPR